MLRRFFGENPQQGREVTGRGGENGGRSRRTRRRPRVEALEGRRLLSAAITEFPLPESVTGVTSMVKGPDGNLWFVLPNIGKIDRITTGGTITEFTLPEDSQYGGTGFPIGVPESPESLTPGPDGALWFTAAGFNPYIGRIATDGTITEFPLPVDPSNPFGFGSAGSSASDIVAGPDGDLWFVLPYLGEIGRITTGGTVTEFPLPEGSQPGGALNPNKVGSLTPGPDGALWFTEDGKIGRIATDGTVTEFPAPAAFVGGITAGPDGALWFTETGGIGRITTAGQVTSYPISDSGAFPVGITVGPDGALWFTDRGTNAVGRITTDGTIVEFPLNSDPETYLGLGNDPSSITTGPDGNLWITEDGTDKVARLDMQDASYAAGGADIYTTPGTPLNPVVASIVDMRPGASLGDFSATIAWGDGSSSAGTIAAEPGGVFAVSGAHTYTAAGTFPIVVTIQDGRTGEALTADASANINVPPGFTVGPDGTLIPDDPAVNPIDVPPPSQALNTGPMAPSATVVPSTATVTTSGTTPGPDAVIAAGHRLLNLFESRLLAQWIKPHRGPVAHASHAKGFSSISQRALHIRAFHIRHPR